MAKRRSKTGAVPAGRPTRVSVSELGYPDEDASSVEQALRLLRARHSGRKIVWAGPWSPPKHYSEYGESGVWQRRDWRLSSTAPRHGSRARDRRWPHIASLAGRRRYDGAIVVYYERS